MTKNLTKFVKVMASACNQLGLYFEVQPISDELVIQFSVEGYFFEVGQEIRKKESLGGFYEETWFQAYYHHQILGTYEDPPDIIEIDLVASMSEYEVIKGILTMVMAEKIRNSLEAVEQAVDYEQDLYSYPEALEQEEGWIDLTHRY